MRHDTITIIDRHIVVSCNKAAARELLADPVAVASWFGAHHRCDRTTVGVDGTTLEFRHEAVDWQPEQCAILTDGTVSGLRYHAHLTVRSVVRAGASGALHEATEIWAHVELASAHRKATTVRAIRSLLRRGLDHLRLELDAGPPIHR